MYVLNGHHVVIMIWKLHINRFLCCYSFSLRSLQSKSFVLKLLLFPWPWAALFLNLPSIQPHKKNNTAALCHWLTDRIDMCLSVWCIIAQVKSLVSLVCFLNSLSLLCPPPSCPARLFWQPWVSDVWVALGRTRVRTQRCPPILNPDSADRVQPTMR